MRATKQGSRTVYRAPLLKLTDETFDRRQGKAIELKKLGNVLISDYDDQSIVVGSCAEPQPEQQQA